MDAHALKWSLVWSETVFSTSGIVNVERGSFNLSGETLWLTFFVRLTAWVEGTCQVRLRQGMEDNAEFSGGVQFKTLTFQDDSDYRSLVAGLAAAPFGITAHNMLAIYNPHWSVRLTAALGGGGTVDLSYEVYAAALVLA